MAYAGGYPVQGAQYGDRWATGHVYVCYTKYRISDGDPNGDYYALVADSHWTYSAGNKSYPARMYQFVASNATSKDNVYGSTPGFTSNQSCSTSFSVSFGVGPFSVSTSPRVCSGYTVSRTTYSYVRSNWQAEKVGGLSNVETAYSQKVANGTVPKFEVHFAIPNYGHYYNGSYWQTTANWTWVDWYGV